MEKEELLSIYQSHFKQVFHASYRITGDAALSEDICQDIFLSLLDTNKDFKAIKNVGGYLRRAATNNSINKIKRSPHWEELSEMADEKDEINWDQYSIDEILGAIQQLPEGYRIIVEKHLLDDLTHENIAKDLNIHPGTSRSQYNRAKKKLRQILTN